MFTNWLMPIPEKSYIRVMYVGRLKLVWKDEPEVHCWTKRRTAPTLEEMIKDIWEKASVFNKEHFISGHLSCSKTLHVVQLLEGEEGIVRDLMGRIRKDPRVVIEHVFMKNLLTINAGWEISLCYSFEITPVERKMVQNKDLSIQQMYDMMKNTYQVRKENKDIATFYKNIIECILLKYIFNCRSESKVEKLGQEIEKLTAPKSKLCILL